MSAPDVLIVGGGLLGLATALSLRERGLAVTVVDRGSVGAESSTAGAGLLMAQAETMPFDETDLVASAYLAASLRSRGMSVRFAQRAAAEGHRSVTVRTGGILRLAVDDTGFLEMERQVAWQTGRELAAELVDPARVQKLAPGVSSRRGAFFPDDGYVDNQALVVALVEQCRGAGVVLREDEAVVRLLVEDERVVGVETQSGRRAAGQVVLAAGAWHDALLPEGEPAPGVRPSRGQMVVLAGKDVPERPVLYGDVYLVPRSGGRVLLGATVEDAGFEKRVTPEGMRFLLDGLAEFFPSASGWEFVTAWSGLRPRLDSPVIGPARSVAGLWHAAGLFRNGILWAPLVGEWLTAGIVDGSMPPEASAFTPAARLAPAGR